jgi:hypothetical protein
MVKFRTAGNNMPYIAKGSKLVLQALSTPHIQDWK